MAPWERHCGNDTMGMAALFFIICFKNILHRMIEMFYFDGSIGTGGEGQKFFLLSIPAIFLLSVLFK